jgi:hypothetical protein
MPAAAVAAAPPCTGPAAARLQARLSPDEAREHGSDSSSGGQQRVASMAAKLGCSSQRLRSILAGGAGGVLQQLVPLYLRAFPVHTRYLHSIRQSPTKQWLFVVAQLEHATPCC